MRYIPITVSDEYVLGDNVSAGAVGSHNDVALAITFGDMWEGTAKTIVWHDASGENPVLTVLTSTMTNEDGAYIVPIPAEPKAVEGEMTITIKGATVDGETETSATMSVTAHFDVLPSAWDEDAAESADITATQAEQFNATLESMKATITDARAAATEAAASEAAAAQSEINAKASENAAAASEQAASDSAVASETSKNAAALSASNAAASETAAKYAQMGAELEKTKAAEHAGASADSASAAEASATAASTSASEAAKSEAVASSAQTASQNAQTVAQNSAISASASSTKAAESAQAAAESAKAAEDAKAGVAESVAEAATYKTLAESWAVGGTGTRTGEDENNSKYWSDKAEEIAKQIDDMAKGKGIMLIATYDPDKDGSVNEADVARKLKTAANITVGNKTNSFDGSSGISFTLSDIGAEASGAATSAVSAHNTSTTAHSDIRAALNGKETAGAAAAVQGNLDTHTGNTVVHITASERTTWNAKQAAITGGASTIASSNLTANRALVSNSSGKVAVSAVTSTELGYLDGVTSNVQTQLNTKTSTATASVTLDAWSAGSSDYYCTKAVSGVTSSNKVIVSPNNTADAIKIWGKCGIYASAQGTNSITFRAAKLPSTSIIANVLIIN